jgi:hypothetical protein
VHLGKRRLAIVIAALTLAVAVAAVPAVLDTASAVRSGLAAVPRLRDTLPNPVREHFRLQDGHGVTFRPNHRNYAARTNAAAPLLLFLPATRERPSNYSAFLTTAREDGYHVLALDYWNDGRSVQLTCGTDPHCYGDVQRNRLDGSHPTRFSAIDASNSIENRLGLAISHLSATDPSGGWSGFDRDGNIDWSRIVVAGHSQGGGESAYISHQHRVLGVLMFSSPVDSDNGVDASWMSTPGATPAARMYGFDDTGDIFASRIRSSWDALGMGSFGSPDNVDFGALGTAHELLSTRSLGTPMQSHSFDITDSTPRTTGGHPIFRSVWSWMLRRVWSGSIGTS